MARDAARRRIDLEQVVLEVRDRVLGEVAVLRDAALRRHVADVARRMHAEVPRGRGQRDDARGSGLEIEDAELVRERVIDVHRAVEEVAARTACA